MEFYTIEEIAEKMKVDRRTLYSLIQSGKLKAHKVGKSWRISEMQYKEFLESTVNG